MSDNKSDKTTPALPTQAEKTMEMAGYVGKAVNQICADTSAQIHQTISELQSITAKVVSALEQLAGDVEAAGTVAGGHVAEFTARTTKILDNVARLRGELHKE